MFDKASFNMTIISFMNLHFNSCNFKVVMTSCNFIGHVIICVSQAVGDAAKEKGIPHKSYGREFKIKFRLKLQLKWMDVEA